MIIKIDTQEIELKTTLRTLKKVEDTFKKPFVQVFRGMTNMTVEDMASVLYCGVYDNDLKKPAFIDLILDNMNLAKLMENVQEFITQIQYSGLDEKEIAELEAKNLEQAQKLKANGLGDMLSNKEQNVV